MAYPSGIRPAFERCADSRVERHCKDEATTLTRPIPSADLKTLVRSQLGSLKGSVRGR
jgi:hypothetical protein